MQDERTTDIVRRLKSVEGHVRGVERMVGEDAYCIDVVNQILAIQRALKKVSGLVLDQHLHHCVTSAIRGTDEDALSVLTYELMGGNCQSSTPAKADMEYLKSPLDTPGVLAGMRGRGSPYGDGHAAERIESFLREKFHTKEAP